MNFEQVNSIKPKEETEAIKTESEEENVGLSGEGKWEKYEKYLSEHGIIFKSDDELRKLSYGDLKIYESEMRKKILALETKLINEKKEMPMVIAVAAYNKLRKTENPRDFLSFQEGN